jgi:hypothetical protein
LAAQLTLRSQGDSPGTGYRATLATVPAAIGMKSMSGFGIHSLNCNKRNYLAPDIFFSV